MVFCPWLLSQSVTPSRSIQVAASVSDFVTCEDHRCPAVWVDHACLSVCCQTFGWSPPLGFGALHLKGQCPKSWEVTSNQGLAAPRRSLFLFSQAGRFWVTRCRMGPAGPGATALCHSFTLTGICWPEATARGTLGWQMRCSLSPWQAWLAEACGEGSQRRARKLIWTGRQIAVRKGGRMGFHALTSSSGAGCSLAGGGRSSWHRSYKRPR